MPKAITIKEFEERKNEKFPQFKTIEFKNMTSPYKFFCEKHGKQTIDNCYTFLNSKYGCSECFREMKSKDNKIIIPKRVKYNNDELKEKLIKLNGNKYNYLFPEYNLVIEVQGEQHYIDNGWKSGKEFKEQQTRDKIKREYCKNNNIKELEIPYWETSEAEDILREELIIE